MQALVLTPAGPRLETTRPVPAPPPGEVVIDLLAAGICETDLQLIAGYMGFTGVLGHEFVGVPRAGRFAGRRVVGEINCPCRTCTTCRSGLLTHCPRRTVLGILRRDGAFAESLILPEDNLHPLPDSLPTSHAVFVEPLAAAFQITVQLPDLAGRSLLLLGDGRLAYLCAQVLNLAGARVLIVGKHPAKLARFAALDFPTLSLDELLADLDADPGVHAHAWEIVVDCTGSPSGFPLALRTVAPRGTVVLKTTLALEQTLSLAGIVIDEVRVVGSRCGPFPPAIAALRAQAVEVESLIEATYPLARARDALHHAGQPGTSKILLTPG